MCSFSYIVHRTLIWLRKCYLLIKTQRSILKWYDSTICLKQLSSSTNRLVTTLTLNNQPNSSSTIDKSAPIHLDIINDCKKTFFFSPQTSITNFCYKTLHVLRLGFHVAQLFLKHISAPIISSLTDWYCFHSLKSSKWK